MDFSRSIIDWFSVNKRSLPWRDTRDAYRIWISEVVLQQTRVAQGLSYYEALVERFPTVQDLAQALEDEVFSLWQGLGYYSRARNLRVAAQQVVERHGGQFPASLQALLALQGIGPYTGAAIASFAFDLPHAVVDGNVYRVLSRVFGVDLPIDSSAGKRYFAQLAQELLDVQRAGLHNQAVMEFGALQCTPAQPQCGQCPLAAQCVALATKRVKQLPQKAKKQQQRDRYFTFWVLMFRGQVLLGKRQERKDIWSGLYQFPLLESEEWLAPEEALAQCPVSGPYAVKHISKRYKHLLSHQILHAQFVVMEAEQEDIPEFQEYAWVAIDQLQHYALPRLLQLFWEEQADSLR